MADIMDDWFGVDPPPPVPEVSTPSAPAPTRRAKTANVVTGVDNTRKYTTQDTGASRTGRASIVEEEDDDLLGVGLNV